MGALKLALTGGIASGKSTIANLLAEHGAVLIDSDVLAREVVEPGTAGLDAVVDRFGAGVLGTDGSLNRQALGDIIFSDPTARADLNAIVHPAVRARRAELIAGAPPDAIVISVIPLLVESGLADDFDGVIVVDVAEDIQVERLKMRNGFTDRQARDRVAAQASRAGRLAAADWVVDNSGSFEDARAQVELLCREFESPYPDHIWVVSSVGRAVGF